MPAVDSAADAAAAAVAVAADSAVVVAAVAAVATVTNISPENKIGEWQLPAAPLFISVASLQPAGLHLWWPRGQAPVAAGSARKPASPFLLTIKFLPWLFTSAPILAAAGF